MARTERQIAEFMAYYSTAPKEERTWALNHLARQEGKSPAEIRAIYEKFNGNVNLRKGAKAPEEFIGSIQKALREGYSEPQIITMYGTSSTIVQRARKLMKDQEPDEQMSDEKKPASFPSEAYPGQIEDDPMIEEDVKVFLPNDNVQKQSIAGECRSVWFALRDQLVDFLLGTFGTGTELISEAVETGRERTVATVRTADGKMIKCTLRAEDNDA